MLAPDDRQLLMTHLQAPPGMVLGHAVGTTFTLDLASAMVAPFTAASRTLTDSVDPIAALQALRATADRIDIFFQNGHLAGTSAHSGLHAFLEKILHPVQQPRPGYLFHPKIWLLHFVPTDVTNPDLTETTFRLIVTSRNLTTDSSWDVILVLDGNVPDRRPQASNAPLAALVRALPTLTHQELTAERVTRIDRLAENVRRANWELPPGVADIGFHVWGLGDEPRILHESDRVLAVAPFANYDGVLQVPGGASLRPHLVTRQDQIDLMTAADLEYFEDEIYVLDPLADLPDDESGETGPGRLAGLHAKIYVAEEGARAHVFLGSANATESAFFGNVEILVELIGHKKDLGIERILGKDGMGPILTPAGRSGQPVDTEDLEDDRRLEQAVRSLAELDLTATVLSSEMGDESGYRLQVVSTLAAEIPDGMTATLTLPTTPGQTLSVVGGAVVDGAIGPLALTDITAWMVLRVQDHRGTVLSATLKMNLINDPAERLDAVLAAQIDTTEKFLRFLRLLLSLNEDGTAFDVLNDAAGSGSRSFGSTAEDSGLFEALVRALGRDVKALDSIGDLIRRLEASEAGRAVVPPDLAALWPTFEQAAALLRRSTR